MPRCRTESTQSHTEGPLTIPRVAIARCGTDRDVSCFGQMPGKIPAFFEAIRCAKGECVGQLIAVTPLILATRVWPWAVC
ncbi:MAG: hypothetical protein JWM42_368 [Burkholderia sp.]|jgi:hypothetical protein|nr:hypothetical protein [Burkholderia sp.]